MTSDNFYHAEGQVGTTWIESYASEQNCCCSHTVSAFWVREPLDTYTLRTRLTLEA